MPKLEIRRCILEGCTFSGCDLSGAGFADVAFTDCNFSNCRLPDAYFSRCRFFGCKWLGRNWTARCFGRLRWKIPICATLPLTEPSFRSFCFITVILPKRRSAKSAGRIFRRTAARFFRTNFFKTPLSGMDFTQNELLAPILSSPPSELRGAKISLLQAADLIELFGVKVDR